ncbi:MAG: group II intron reverse transcriptase/maturase [Candidatus Polarisedimenticolia bacterium]
MSLGDARPQMAHQWELLFEERGEAPLGEQSEEASKAASGSEHSGASGLMVEALGRRNLHAALKRVRQNQGSPGIDGMTVEELPDWLRENWPRVREHLLAGTYQPQPVQRQPIKKSGGGVRELGIPTVLDRFIQQALLQVLQPRIDPSFSEHSYGFRPGRRAHDAIVAAQRYIQEGRRWVVDLDLEKFFDRVHHDVLMERLSRRIADQTVLRLIRRYLEAGVMVHGVKVERHEGTPQGGPLSPLLANVLLDEVDQELGRRGHAFVRYADDCNVYVRSERAGQRVMAWLVHAYGRLRLRINPAKSAVARATSRSLLGFAFWVGSGGRIRRRAAPEALRVMKDRVRRLTRRAGGRNLHQVAGDLRGYLPGWKAYFRLVETPDVLRRLDQWLRHRLRALQLKHWKRGPTIYRELRARGLSERVAAQVAANGRRCWRNSAMAIHIALPNTLFDELGVPRLAA